MATGERASAVATLVNAYIEVQGKNMKAASSICGRRIMGSPVFLSAYNLRRVLKLAPRNCVFVLEPLRV